MITITKQISINPGLGETGPYQYSWQVTSPSSSCATISPQSTGVIVNPASQTIITTFGFLNQACLEETEITLYITYNNGECVKAFPLMFENPCDEMDVEITVETQDRFKFTANPSGGTGPYSYHWSWDPDLFSLAGAGVNTQQVLRLAYTGPTPAPPATTLFLTVVDAKGCSVNKSMDFSICQPALNPINLTLQCQADGRRSAVFCLDPVSCPASQIDWDSIVLFNLPSTWTLEIIPPTPAWSSSCFLTGGRVARITAASNSPQGFYQGQMSISTLSGDVAYGALNLVVPDCPVAITPISINAQAPFQVTCDYGVNDIFYIGPVSTFVTNAGPNAIDWTSFKFIDQTDGSLTGVLTTPLGAEVTFNQSTLNIEYEVPATSGTDSFTWTVCDTQGNCAQSATYAIVLDCSPVPTATNDAECSACGETSEHDVLANDDVNGVLINLSIVAAPSNGSAVFNGSFSSPRVLYTPNANYSGTDTYEYSITNDQGNTDTATVTVTVQCAGQDSSISVCQ